MFSLNFWKDTAERVIRTSANAGLGLLIASDVVHIMQVDWAGWLQAVALVALISLLDCLSTARIGRKGTASVMKG